MPVRLPKCGGIRAVRPDDVRGCRLLRAEYLTARFPEDAGPLCFYAAGNVDHDMAEIPMCDFRKAILDFMARFVKGKSRWRSIPAKRAPTGRRRKKTLRCGIKSRSVSYLCWTGSGILRSAGADVVRISGRNSPENRQYSDAFFTGFRETTRCKTCLIRRDALSLKRFRFLLMPGIRR